MLMNILIEVFDIAKGLGGDCLVALLLSSFASNGLVLPPLSLSFNVPQSASFFAYLAPLCQRLLSRIGCKVAHKGPKWPKLAKVPAVHHLGPFWVHVDPFRTFSGKNWFLTQKHFDRRALCVFRAENWFLPEKVQKGPSQHHPQPSPSSSWERL